MWPGQQPANGGEQNPQQPNPYQQPGYQQPNPYQRPGPGSPEQNPYAQPAGAGAGQPGGPQWQTPPTLQAPQPPQAPPGPPMPPSGGSGGGRRTTVIAVTAALAVVAAAVVTGFVVLKDDGEKTSAQDDPKPPASASASASPSASPGGSSTPDPSGGGRGDDDGVKPVIAGWKPVISTKRLAVFDVPADWKVEPGMSSGFLDDKGKSVISMSSVASYKDGACKANNSLGGAGTKGAQGAKSEADAAETEALSWVWAAFDQKKTGRFAGTKAKPFTSDHGVSGYTSSATVTGVAKSDACATDGKAFTLTFKNKENDLVTWVLYSAKGVKDELPDDTIKKIMSSLRPLSLS
ncbi:MULTISPECIES: hypothetical protein [Streptomyces]|uniref:hypothetical protein n=1 Tax=Streptomyces TaxID=1883 RepID=UPI00163B747E|nr:MULTISPECIES: hypothetical protein [Streptomyces]MBC2876334.1 hypothetical protein [Streptomyces sp. TYQ1024]UBI35449.1 hypothetical protein K7I03_02520 [Streptomyces mobaraensis]UKW28041.1 hypothetical protein MCU78_02550 [Streptomyces sp. TYQ1024]